MTRDDLIQEINVLGPWVHGYFDLGHGLIIEDQDELQKKRLFRLRDYYCDIIESYYGSKEVKDKTLADVGCNTGYFLFELFNAFNSSGPMALNPVHQIWRKRSLLLDISISRKIACVFASMTYWLIIESYPFMMWSFYRV